MKAQRCKISYLYSFITLKKGGQYVEALSEYASIKYNRANVQGGQISCLFYLMTFTPEDSQQVDGQCSSISNGKGQTNTYTCTQSRTNWPKVET